MHIETNKQNSIRFVVNVCKEHIENHEDIKLINTSDVLSFSVDINLKPSFE